MLHNLLIYTQKENAGKHVPARCAPAFSLIFALDNPPVKASASVLSLSKYKKITEKFRHSYFVLGSWGAHWPK